MVLRAKPVVPIVWLALMLLGRAIPFAAPVQQGVILHSTLQPVVRPARLVIISLPRVKQLVTTVQ